MSAIDRFGTVESRFKQSAENHAEDLRQKVEKLVQDFQPLQMFGDAKDAESIVRKFDIFPSPVKHYRARCRFAIGEIDGKLHYLLYEHGEPSLIADHFPQACAGICRSTGKWIH
jgi:tRNA/tmRNA/rRNA uracil-C5-methylase (TrmA/RlmC/RlmD family)